jgi:hypothetical protein
MRTDLRWASVVPRRRAAPRRAGARSTGAARWAATVTATGLAASALALAGCASAAGANASVTAANASPVTAASVRPATRAEPAPTATASPRGGARTDPPQATANGTAASASLLAGLPTCAAGDLRGEFTDPEGAAGHLYATVVLTNHGGGPCQLAGYPRVEFVGATGAAFGAPAEDDDAWGPAEPVELRPGATASAVLRVTQAGIERGCLTDQETEQADALRVTPPGAGGGLVVALPTGGVTGCLSAEVHQLLVGPLGH